MIRNILEKVFISDDYDVRDVHEGKNFVETEMLCILEYFYKDEVFNFKIDNENYYIDIYIGEITIGYYELIITEDDNSEEFISYYLEDIRLNMCSERDQIEGYYLLEKLIS